MSYKARKGVHLGKEAYRKTTHTHRYLLFGSHHPLEPKLGLLRTLQYRADTVTTKRVYRPSQVCFESLWLARPGLG